MMDTTSLRAAEVSKDWDEKRLLFQNKSDADELTSYTSCITLFEYYNWGISYLIYLHHITCSHLFGGRSSL